MPGHNADIVLTYPSICLMPPELDLVLELAAADFVVVLAVALVQHLVAADWVLEFAAAVVQVDSDLDLPAVGLHQPEVLGFCWF